MTTRVEHIDGVTFHGRKGAIQNAFRYSVDFVLVDAEDPAPLGPCLFTRNGRGITALDDKNHGGLPKDGRGAAWVRDVLKERGIRGVARIELLAQPKVLGYVFNPVSFWLCRNARDELVAVISEVTNTFGDRHSYLCHHANLRPIAPSDRLHATKIMHVSPFQPVEGGYAFRFDIRPDRVGIWIDYTQTNGGVIATLTGRRTALTNRAILRAMWRRPLGARRVLGLIHWQALKLWVKGAMYRARPNAPDRPVSQPVTPQRERVAAE